MILWINIAATIALVLLYSGASHSLEYLELKPRIREQLRAVGDSFFITCLSIKQDNIDLYDIKWKFPSGATVSNNGRVYIEKTNEGFELVFSKVSEDDGGEYTCTAQASDVGQVEKAFRLEVYKKISFDEAPAEQIAKENEDFLLKCKVSGLPKPKINWKAGGDILKSGGKYEYVEDGLLIHKITKEDSKKYECKALQISNTTSAFDLRIITLKVSYAPVWKSNHYHSDHFSWIGGIVSLSCAAEGIPTPTIKWFKSDIHLENGNDMKITSHEGGHSTLKIEVINKAIYGKYTCEASNTISMIERHYTLTEAEKPGPPIVSAESHTVNSIHLFIQPPRKTGGLEIKGYKVFYLLGPQKWETDKQTSVEFNRSDNNYILQPLKPGTIYRIKVTAKTDIGYGKLTDEVVCSTKMGGFSSTRSGNSANSATWLTVKFEIIFLPILGVIWSSGIIVR